MERRRMIDGRVADKLFEYIGIQTFHCKYGRVSINMQVENNTSYYLLPKNNVEEKNFFVFVNVFNSKVAFLYCNNDVNNGGFIENNYSVSNGEINANINIGQNKIYDIDFEVYRYSY